MTSDQLRILACTDSIVVAEIAPVCVVIWRGDVTPERFALQSAGLAEVAARHAPNAAFLCIVESSCKPPSREMRRATNAMLERHASQLRCVAGVSEGSGVLMSIGRLVMTGMAMVFGRLTVPISILENLEDAAFWMQKHVNLLPREVFTLLVEVARTNLDVQELHASVGMLKVAVPVRKLGT